MSEQDVQINACYLHEAGHAVVAITVRHPFIRVQCNGQEGWMEPVPALQLPAAVVAQNAPAAVHADAWFKAWWPRLLTRLGGIAGESLEIGRVIAGVHRGADDIGTFHAIGFGLCKKLSPQQAADLTLKKFGNCLTDAFAIVKRREKAVRAVAEALKVMQEMTQVDVAEVIEAAEQP